MEFLGGQLAVFVLAVVMGILFRYLGLPSLIGQVGVGFLVGLSGLLGQHDVELMKFLGDFGITLLLFLVGLEMNWKELRKVGKQAVFIFLGQTTFVILLFALINTIGMGQGMIGSWLIAIALTFSSTIVVVKMLSEKKNLSSFSGRLSLGLLLLQDMMAILLLSILPSFSTGIDLGQLGWLWLKIVGLFLVVDVVGHAMISLILKEVIKSGEDLILFSLAWFIVVVLLSEKVFGVSSSVGSFLAGLSLSTTWGHFQIINKVKTLRDVFLTLFFVVLGLQVGVGRVNWLMVVVLSVGVITGKFLITYFWSVITGIGSRVAFLVSLNMTQVSEFSLIVMGMGLASGLWNDEVARTVTVTGLITMTLSTLLIGAGEKIYSRAKRNFGFLFKIGDGRDRKMVEIRNHIVLLGCDRTGKSVVSFLEKTQTPFVVVDFNPDIVTGIREKGGEVIFGDATDPDMIDITNMKEARLIISTVKDREDTLGLLAELAHRKIKVPVIVDAESVHDARVLYEAGATYVVFPHFVSGWHMSQLVKKSLKDNDVFDRYREKQVTAMKTIYEGI